MVRTTFGPSGKPITVIDSVAELDSREARSATVIDDQPGATPNFTVVSGDSDGDASDEVASDLGQTRYVDPATAQPRQRRKRGPNKPKQPGATTTGTGSAPFITANLEKVLYNLHNVAAAMLSEPDWAISKDESAILAEAVKEVAAAYDFTALMNPRTQAWIDFGIACTAVYGSRIAKVIKPRHRMAVVQPQPVQAPQAVHQPYVPPKQPITVMEAYRETHGAEDVI
jgi:hypothetical protein